MLLVHLLSSEYMALLVRSHTINHTQIQDRHEADRFQLRDYLAHGALGEFDRFCYLRNRKIQIRVSEEMRHHQVGAGKYIEHLFIFLNTCFVH